MQKEYDLKGNIRSNSIIMCEMMITSDNEFFNKIGLEETKRYFIESYKFVCNYKNLGEKNIVSAEVHLDETTPNMHLVYIPVIHTKDDEGNDIDKICAREYWKGRNSYRKLQDAFHAHVTSKGFDLERGLPVEETGAKNLKIEELKKITNFANTKKLLNNIKLELPEVPDILENKFYNRINELEKENYYLNKIINKFKETIEKFIHWICKRFSIAEEDLIREFQMENDTYLDPEKQIQYEEELEYEDLEL